MTAPALLAEVRRGPVVEVAVRGHVAVVDAAGRLLAHAGDPDAVTTVRSAVKPLQALPFVERAVDAVGAGVEEVAIACASHDGAPRHVETVRRLLGRAGLDEGALSCAAHVPYSADAAWALAAAGERPRRVHNNCSGKHAAMLATCVVEGWPVAGYASPDHPMQRAVAEAMARDTRADIAALPAGVDGCGLPTVGMPLRLLAHTAAAATRHGSFRRCQEAMAAHPLLVGGEARFDTALLDACGERITAKSGGAAVWLAVVRPGGPAVAVKLEAGIGPQMPPVALAVLQALDLLPGTLPDGLRRHATGVVSNWAGEEVGETRTTTVLERG